MAKLGDLIVRVGADTSTLNNDLKQAKSSMKKMTGELQNVGKQMSMAVTAPLVIMGATSVQAFREQNKAIAQVEAGLKSTANQVGFTSKELQKMATDLQNKTLFGDEVILKDATAQLLTFTNISGENFARTQQAALDLATRLDGDLKGASIQLGKALNDPVANLSALSRSGIQFSDEQKEVIKTLAETGRLAEAQTLILDELNKQYGGSAEAAAEADGGFTQLANSFGDLQEIIGGLLIEYLKPIVNQLKTFIQWLSKTSRTTQTIALAFAAFAAAIGPLLFIIPNVISGIKAVGVAIQFMNTKMLATPFGMYAAAAAGIIALGAAIYSVTASYRDLNAAQNALNDNTSRALALTAEQRTKTELLITTAQDMNAEEGKRLAAIQELNKISPKYLGGLTLENVNHSEGKAMLAQYNEELLRKAKLQAAQEKIVEIEKQLLDLQQQQAEGPGLGMQALGYGLGIFGQALVGEAHQRQTSDEMQNLKDQQQALTQFLSENTTAADLQAQSVTNTADAYADLSNKTETNSKSIKENKDEIEQYGTTLEDVFRGDTIETFSDRLANIELPELEEFDIVEEIFGDEQELVGAADMIIEKFEEVKQAFKDFNTSATDSIISAANSAIVGFGMMLGEGIATGKGMKGVGMMLLEVFANLAIELGTLAVGYGIAIENIKIALKSLSGPVAIAAGIALIALGAGLKGAISKRAEEAGVPEFADGGLVYGPTMGLVGEYPGARTNPEVIAPLDKLRSMLGGQSVQVTGRLSGRDILLSSEYSNIDRNRIRGY